MRSNAGMADCSAACRDDFCFGLPRPEAEVLAAWAVFEADAEGFEAEREDDECFATPPVLEIDDLRGAGGFTPGGKGFFLGGAIV